jgi:hypothetical protein
MKTFHTIKSPDAEPLTIVFDQESEKFNDHHAGSVYHGNKGIALADELLGVLPTLTAVALFAALRAQLEISLGPTIIKSLLE